MMCCATIAIMKDHHLSSRAWKRSNSKTAIKIQFLLLSPALPHRVAAGKEPEPDAAYCQHLVDNIFTPCFNAHPGLSMNSADLGLLEIGPHGANLQGSGSLENEFQLQAMTFRWKI